MTAQYSSSVQKDIWESTHHLTLNWMSWNSRGLRHSPIPSAKNKKMRRYEPSHGMTEGRKNKAQSEKSWFWCGALVTRSRCGLHGHSVLFVQIDMCMSFHMHTLLLDCSRNMTISPHCSRTHISTKQSTFGMMWNVLIAAYMHHYGVSIDQTSQRTVYNTLLNLCFHEMAKWASNLLNTHTVYMYTMCSIFGDPN